MGLDIHTIDVAPGSSPLAQPDRIAFANLPNQANGAGGSAGAAVTVAITGLQLPPTYSVQGCMSQAGDLSVSSKTQTGFTVTLTPPSSSVTLAAGTFDVTIFA